MCGGASQVVLVVKNPPAKAGDTREARSIPRSGRSPAVENGNMLQCSCLENSMNRGAWHATVHGAAKSRTRLSDWEQSSMCGVSIIEVMWEPEPCGSRSDFLVTPGEKVKTNGWKLPEADFSSTYSTSHSVHSNGLPQTWTSSPTHRLESTWWDGAGEIKQSSKQLN